MPAFEREGNVVSCLGGCSGSGGAATRVSEFPPHYVTSGRWPAAIAQWAHYNHATHRSPPPSTPLRSTLSQTLPSVRSLSS